ncbi:MAG: DUF2577 domain-containing protein [Firmicutes bacterium]|nr:DUF2577 domain-containing protein [Bacillota bacterium]
MDGITELAKLLKERENEKGYSPIFGTIIELPNTKIRISDKIILTDSYIKTLFDFKQQNADNEYIYLGSKVLLLPYQNNQKFIMIGVLR